MGKHNAVTHPPLVRDPLFGPDGARAASGSSVPIHHGGVAMNRPSDNYLHSKCAIHGIVVGHRQRKDLGDLDALAASISEVGMLQPITITDGNVLLCGYRRLMAARQLKWRSVPVWIRTGLSDRLTILMAERDENALREPLNQVEAAALYAELKGVLAEEARARQESSRFGGSGGAAHAAAPRGVGDVRRIAARTVTGAASYTRLERINWMLGVSKDFDLPKPVRELASAEVEELRQGAGVAPAVNRVRAAIRLAEEDAERKHRSWAATLFDATPADVDEAEHLTLVESDHGGRLEDAQKPTRASNHPAVTAAQGRGSALEFSSVLDGASAILQFDPAVVGPHLDEDTWATLHRTVESLRVFLEVATETRRGTVPKSA